MALGMNNDKYDYILSKLHPYNITKNNTIFEWHQDFIENEPGHRHLSHMYSLYPGEEIDFKSKLAPYFYNTIERRLENGSGQTGWSKAWITCLVARLHKEKETYKLFKEWIKNSTSKSLLDLHPPFQIDGNFGIATAIRLMFFESREDGLELLPSLGTYLKYYKLSNFRLKNDLMLDLEYQNKYLEFNIISNVEMDYLIYFKDKEFKIKLKKGDNYYYFDLNKKEIEILTD